MTKLRSILFGVAMATLVGPSALADNGYNFEGLHIGVYGGGIVPCDCLTGGVAAGYDFALGGGFIAGVEMQAGAVTTQGYEFWGLGNVGYALTEDVRVYKILGAGVLGGSTAFGLGAGVEALVTDDMSIGVEGMAINFGGGFSEYRFIAKFGYRPM